MSIPYASEQLEKKFSLGEGIAFARRGEALYREQWTDEAIQLLVEGTRAFPAYVTGFLMLGRIYKETGRLVEANVALESALKLEPRCPAALKLMSEISLGLHSHGESARYLRVLAAIEPWDVEIQQDLRKVASPNLTTTTSTSGTAEMAAITEYNLNDMAEFLPKDDLASALATDTETSEETPFSAAAAFNPLFPDHLSGPSAKEKPPGQPSGQLDPAPVTGDDVENRLNSLFGLESSVAMEPTAETPVAKSEEGISIAALQPDSSMIYTPPHETSAVIGEETTGFSDTTLQEKATGAFPDSAVVTGQDVESRLDTLFGLEESKSFQPPAGETHEAFAPPATHDEASHETSSLTETAFAHKDTVLGEDVEKRLDALFPPAAETPELTHATETSGWEKASVVEEAEPPQLSEHDPVTGDDISSRLNQMFAEEDDALPVTQNQTPAASVSTAPEPAPEQTPAVADKLPTQPELAGIDDRTLVMPAFKPSTASDDSFETQAHSLAVHDSDLEDFSATVAHPVEENVLETEDLRPFTETGAYELSNSLSGSETVVGDDISQRLDQLFGLESETTFGAKPGTDPGTSETSAFAAAESATAMVHHPEGNATVSGDDVENRLDEIFGKEVAEPPRSQPETESKGKIARDSENESAAQTLGLTRADVFSEDLDESLHEESRASTDPAPLLAMEEEPAEDDAAAPPSAPNVATVTLAEIYFQQGLKEQALQIYRQLLEREPENETVRKRVEEIESFKSDDDAKAQDSDGDRRTPRPGLKVPRRKK